MLSRLSLVLIVLTACALAADITGAWKFTVETDQGSGNPSFTFKQDGEKLTGTYKGLFGEAKVAGTIKGETVEFWIEAEGAGKIVYTGKVESATRMSGTVKLGDVASGKFTAVKE